MSLKWLVIIGVITFGVGLGMLQFSGSSSVAADKTPDAAVERTRREVRILDDVYKTAIVLITKHYVTEKSDLPAGEAFKALFSAMKEKGWHEVRLLDATGDPLEKANLPQDDFEKDAILRLKAKESFVDQVVELNGKRYLRAATPIPVVMEKCAMCHDNYKNNKGVIGALAYKLPIE